MSKEMTEIEQKHQSLGDNVGGNKQTNNNNAPVGISGTRDVYVGKLEVNSSSFDILGVTIDIGKPLKDCTEKDFENLEKLLSMVAQRPVKIEFGKEGSIKLFLSGSEEGLQRLADLQAEGKLEELLNELKPDDMPEIKVKKAEFIEDEEVIKKAVLIKDIRKGKADKTKLREADLSEANLYGANLSGANLYGANLSGANLYGANLKEIQLIRADLRRANLREIQLIRADLRETDLRETELIRADLRRANLYRANLSGANLSGANLSGANLKEANLSGANLIRTNLKEADLRRIDLREADLIVADLTGANMRGANLRRADLSEVDLDKADLSGANLQETNLRETNLSGADLSGSYLYRADLSGSKLRETNLSGAYLSGTEIDEKTQIDDKWRLVHDIVNNNRLENRALHSQDLSFANLQHSFLYRANLIGANLTESNLRYANLQEADLSGSNLTRANLEYANLIDAVFDHAIVKGAKFKDNEGITEGLKRDLKAKGAIFADDFGAGDRVLARV